MQPEKDSRLRLPEAGADASAHSDRVVRHIRKAIGAAGGSISFAEFMQLALYAPGLGYYSAGASKLGAAGDFVTAPEISPVFAAVLARQVAIVLQQLDGGDVFEPGAGSGALAVSMLRKLAALDALPRRYLILEVSADFRQRQEARFRREMPEFIERIGWLSQLPERFSGVVVANEVADAMPVERFLIRGGEVLQARVRVAGNHFGWCFEPAPVFLQKGVRQIEADIGRALEDGYQSELAPGLSGWITQLSRGIRRGMIFLLDYGVTRREFYAPERRDGWLRCHFRHHAHNDPLILAGIQDLTSWVDFSAVAAAATSAGLDVAGYVTQANLLLGGGLEHELENFSSLPLAEQAELSRQVKLLTLPAEMGENFKCIGLSRGIADLPAALTQYDRAHLL